MDAAPKRTSVAPAGATSASTRSGPGTSRTRAPTRPTPSSVPSAAGRPPRSTSPPGATAGPAGRRSRGRSIPSAGEGTALVKPGLGAVGPALTRGITTATWNGPVIAESDDIVTVEGNASFPFDAVREDVLRPS